LVVACRLSHKESRIRYLFLIWTGPFKGKTVGVDLSSWLYRGAYGCASALALGKNTTRYVDYVLRRLRLLRFNGVEVIVVADNEATMMKHETELSRRAGKDAKRAAGMRLHDEGMRLPPGCERNERLSQAETLFQGCLSITKAMVSATLSAAHAEGFEVVVAPFEADPQLAHLCRCGRAQGVITEDSDLVVYSVLSEKPFPLILKMDQWGVATTLLLNLDSVGAATSEGGSRFVQNLQHFGGSAGKRM
jgi:hypothetical protein